MIAASLNKNANAGIDIRRGQVSLPSGALRTVGEHPAQVALGKDITADVTVAVAADEGLAEVVEDDGGENKTETETANEEGGE